ncbi:MAG: lipocalin-like domain-containing protein [Bacteroidia bacterium]|nr:lipocalin-like domain-containing protein [Bacteroidia bacterium]
MKKLILLSLICASIFLTQCNPKPQSAQSTHPLIGLWKLEVMEVFDAESGSWKEWKKEIRGFGEGIKGYILYAESGHMALHLVPKNYESTELEFPYNRDSSSFETLKHLAASYVYISDYEIDPVQQTVRHATISHSEPNDWGEIVNRRYSFTGDTLLLEPVEQDLGKLRLKWTREK